MTINEACEAIYERFRAGWAAGAYASTPVAYDDGILNPTQGTAWVRVVVRHARSEMYSIGRQGNRRHQRRGVVLVELFVPAGAGRKVGDLMATVAQNILESDSDPDGIEYLEGTIREAGTDGPWRKVDLEIPISYLEVK